MTTSPRVAKWALRVLALVFLHHVTVCTVCEAKALHVIRPHRNFAGLDVQQSSVADLQDEGKGISFAQTYRERDIWFGMLYFEYVITASTTMTLAFKSMAKYIYTAPFLTKLFASNRWLKYSTLDFPQKQQIIRKIARRASSKSLFTRALPGDRVADLFADMYLRRVTSRLSRTPGFRKPQYLRMKEDLTQLIKAANAPTEAMEVVLGNNTQDMFTWIDSVRQNPFATVKNVVVHAFENGLKGVSGMVEWELNQGCFAIAQQTRHILPFGSLFPGGILGKIMQKLMRSYIMFFHPVLANFKGLLALFLGVLCKVRLPQLINAVFGAIFRAKRRAGRYIHKFFFKTISLRKDITGKILVDDLVRGSGAVMITLLFQLHGVDIDAISRRGGAVESGVLAGQGVWALSDGLFVGLKDFGQLFRAYFERYVNLTSAIHTYCAKQTTNFFTETELDEFYNGENVDRIPPRERLLAWCDKNKSYLAIIEKDFIGLATNFLNHMVKCLKMDFKYFEGYLANIMSIFYEMTFATLESDIVSAINANQGRAPHMLELEAILKRRQQANNPPKEAEMPRTMFRKPWMRAAIRKLAHGYFSSAAGFALKTLLQQIKPANAEKLLDKAFTRVKEGSKLIRSSLTVILGRFFNSQALIVRAHDQTVRMRMYEFINQCQNPEDPNHRDVCGNNVTTNIDEVKFVSKSLLALNLGILVSPRDLLLSQVIETDPAKDSIDPTEFFVEWEAWLQAKGYKPHQKGKEYLLFAEDINQKANIIAFVEALRHTLRDRLRFGRFDQEGADNLRLFDYNGRSAIFRPRDPQSMWDRIKEVRPDPLDAPATFEVLDYNEGILRFSSKPGIPFEGRLEYADDRRELRSIQQDPQAIKELLVSQIMQIKPRLSAEMTATLMMVLHRYTTSFHRHSFATFLQNLSPKMFFDGVLAFADQHQQQAEATLHLDRRLYSFPMTFQTFKDIVFNSLNTMVLRMHSLDTADSLSVFLVGLVHYAYQKIQKNRTGRTLVMQHFLRGLVHVMRSVDAERFREDFPECQFLIEPNGTIDEVVAIKCALYRFVKLRSLELPRAIAPDVEESRMTEARARTYLNGFVEYLDRLRPERTSWASFLNFKGFLETAELYRETVGAYSYEELERQIKMEPITDLDVLEQLRALMDPSLGRIVAPKKDEGTAQVIRKIWGSLGEFSSGTRQRVRSALSQMRSRLVSVMGSTTLPKAMRLFNVMNGSQFFGALEFAEFRAFPDTRTPPEDILKASDLALFGRVLLVLETTPLYLDNPKQMSDIVMQMRSIPFISPECQDLFREIEEMVRHMSHEDVRVAVGWLLTFNIGKGLTGSTVALGLLALAGVPFANSQISHQDKIGILRTLDADTLRFIKKHLLMPMVFRHMASLSDVEAMNLLRFVPKATLLVAYPASIRYLPLSEPVNVVDAVDKLIASKAIDAVQQHLGQVRQLPGEASHDAVCRTMINNIKVELGLSTEDAMKFWTRSHMFFDKRLPAACILLIHLKAMREQNIRETTVAALVDMLYYNGTALNDHLAFIAKKGANELERQKQIDRVGSLLTMVYVAVVSGSLQVDASFMGYSGETKNLTFHSRRSSRGTEVPLLTACIQATTHIMGPPKEKPEIFQASLSSYFLGEWFRFVETSRLEEYAAAYRRGGGFQNISRETLKNISSVYNYYDIGDYFISIRQRSLYPQNEIVKAASMALIQDEATIDDYGMAMLTVDMGHRVRKAKIKCYEDALKDYVEYVDKSRSAQEMFKIDCVHNYFIDMGSLGYSAASITPEQKDQIIASLDRVFAGKCEDMYTALIGSQPDIHKLKQQAWAFATLAHNSLNSATRLGSIVNMLHNLITDIAAGTPWNDVVDGIAAERANKIWERVGDVSHRTPIYTAIDRPYLFNPFAFLLDFLLYVKTNKAHKLRMPKMLLMKRAAVLKELPFKKKTTPPGMTEYKERAAALKDAFFAP
ncbi:rhoptry neck protein RON3 [Toxoplasma gondii VAND]|uniref:Rhoptry neck protein RON3 n=1 Tax=Toxoplasma gondii VAND TaxID=933077 RepID=A0A086QLT4_TOXGO|nr:rhoptry neck protein RON3 [Toxoplasma gondii VAND]